MYKSVLVQRVKEVFDKGKGSHNKRYGKKRSEEYGIFMENLVCKTEEKLNVIRNGLLKPELQDIEFSCAGGSLNDEYWIGIANKIRNLHKNINLHAIFESSLVDITDGNLLEFLRSREGPFNKLLDDLLLEKIDYVRKLRYREEKEKIVDNLRSSIIFNLTESNVIPDKIIIDFCNGSKFIDPLLYECQDDKKFIATEVSGFINRMFQNRGKIRPWALKEDMLNLTQNPKLGVGEVQFLFNVIESVDSMIPIVTRCRDKLTAKVGNIKDVGKEDSSSYVLLQADKNLGIALFTKNQVMRIYDQINDELGYTRLNITESDSVKEFVRARNDIIPTIPEGLKSYLTVNQVIKFHTKTGTLGILRPLPKLHKMPSPSYAHFNSMRSRAIKAASDDPVNNVASVLASLSKGLISEMKDKILEESGLEVSVDGCDNAYNLINGAKGVEDKFHHFIGEADAKNLYPSLKYLLVRSTIIKLFTIIQRSNSFKKFFLACLHLVMTYNRFIEPKGIFSTDPSGGGGFAIGCKFAADGSELVLLFYELMMIRKLLKEGLMDCLVLFLRFRDDLFFRLQGDLERSLRTLKIMAMSYPKDLTIELKISPFSCSFLDMTIKSHTPTKPFLITLLRKKEARYDIARPSSDTPVTIKESAHRSNILRSYRRTNNRDDVNHQLRVGRTIALERGFTSTLWSKLRKIYIRNVKKKELGIVRRKDTRVRKKFSGGVTYGETLGTHIMLRDLMINCSLPKSFEKPIYLPGRSVFSKYHSNKKLIKEMTTYSLKNDAY